MLGRMHDASEIIASSEPAVSFELHPVRALAYALQHRLTALMVAGEGRHLWFEDGLAVWAEVPEPTPALRDVLATFDDVDQITLGMLAPGAPSEDELARELLEANALSRETLARARNIQLAARLEHILALGEGVAFQVYRTNRPKLGLVGLPVGRCYMIAARGPHNGDMVDRYVGRLGDMALSVLRSADLKSCGFTASELAVARRLQELPATVAELLAAGAPRRDVHSVVFALSMSGALQRTSQPGQGSLPVPSTPPAPPSQPARASRPDFTPVPLSQPPDSSPRPSIRDRPFRRGPARSERVSQPGLRRDTPAPGIPDAPISRPSAQRVSHALKLSVEAFERAERALGMGDFGGAARHIAKALSYDPDNRQYQALAAFSAADRNAGNKKVEESMRRLRELLDEDDGNAAAHYYLARLYKRDRKHKAEALAHFRRAAELDPSNRHAVSEALQQK